MKSKRFICLVLSLVMLLALALPVGVFADDDIYLEEEYVLEEEDVLYPEEDLVEEILLEDDSAAEETEIYEEIVEDELVNDEQEETVDVQVEEEDTAVVPEEETEPFTVMAEEIVEADTFASDAIVINEQPADIQNAEVGNSYKLHVGAQGNSLTYRWYISTDNGESWTTTGAKGYATATLTISVKDTYNGYQYKCRIKDANGNTKDSAAATVTLAGADPITITSQPADIENAEVGQKYSLKVVAEGNSLTYQWYISTDGGNTWKTTGAAGNKTATLKISVKDTYDGYQYKCTIKDAKGNTKDSDAATVKLVDQDPIKITSQPADIENAEVGQTYSLKVVAEGNSLTYQWYISTDGGNTWKTTGAAGNKTATLKISVKDTYDGYQYKCTIKDAKGNTKDSDAATVTLSLADEQFTYAVDEVNNGMIVTKYLLDEAEVTVPDTFSGKPITQIGANAFEGKTTLTTIHLPDTIMIIGTRAFADCTSLANMD